MIVSGNFFKALGVAPALGRVFTDEEDQPNTNDVAVLSDRFWRTHFGADAAVVGRDDSAGWSERAGDWRHAASVRTPAALVHSRSVASNRVHAGAAPEPWQQLSPCFRAPEAGGHDRCRAAVDGNARRELVQGDQNESKREHAALAAAAVHVEHGDTQCDVVHVRARWCRPADRLRQPREPSAGSQRGADSRTQRSRSARREAFTPAATLDDREPRPRVPRRGAEPSRRLRRRRVHQP